MEVGELQPFGSKLINVGRADFTAVGAGVTEAQVIGDDQQNIGPFRRHNAGQGAAESKQQGKGKHALHEGILVVLLIAASIPVCSCPGCGPGWPTD